MAQNAFWGPKTHFGLQNALLGPKAHFLVHFAPWLENLIKQRFPGAFLGILGAKNRKWAHFSTFGSKSANCAHLRISKPTSAKLNSFLHFGSKSAEKRPRNHLFNKLFEPGREMEPRRLFWSPKNALWIPESPFGFPKRTSGPKVTLFGPFCALAPKAY